MSDVTETTKVTVEQFADLLRETRHNGSLLRVDTPLTDIEQAKLEADGYTEERICKWIDGAMGIACQILTQNLESELKSKFPWAEGEDLAEVFSSGRGSATWHIGALGPYFENHAFSREDGDVLPDDADKVYEIQTWLNERMKLAVTKGYDGFMQYELQKMPEILDENEGIANREESDSFDTDYSVEVRKDTADGDHYWKHVTNSLTREGIDEKLAVIVEKNPDKIYRITETKTEMRIISVTPSK